MLTMLRTGWTSPGVKQKSITSGIKAIVFDGDDTLWVTQPLFDQAKAALAKIIRKKLGVEPVETLTRLDEIDIANIAKMGFSPKRFPTSLVETFAHFCTSNGLAPSDSEKQHIYSIGAAIFTKSPVLLKDVKRVLSSLGRSYQLILYTLGDVATQQRIIKALKLERFFPDAIYIVSEKTSVQLEKVLEAKDLSPDDVLMVGNSVKSDINPALELGIKCVWVNRHSWAYDKGSQLPGEVIEISQLRELPGALTKRFLSQKQVHEGFRPFARV